MTNFLKKINQLDKKLNYGPIHNQVEEINAIVEHVANQEVLPVTPAPLGLLPDQFEDVADKLNEEQKVDLKAINNLLNSLRQFLSLKYGVWSLSNKKTATLIKQELAVNSALEIMAGNAYWSKALNEAGIRVIATDSLEWAKTSSTGKQAFYPVVDLDAVSAIKKFAGADLILCSWAPNFGKSDLDVIRAWKKFTPESHLLFIGEKEGATNSPEFWENENFVNSPSLRKINRSFKSYDFIDEQIYEIKHEL
ncbi:hypothetical protein [Lactobacillus acetotolerans]|uniref:hypothetical protein n=1 Tax=Lactobacillus acetotolerans TaxID=1600 RepID=UPI0007BAB5C7|nr:hypothetical protein [Lactobacillus acetotolerans]QGV04604.1 SAM-dependent methyltransferase [Lactobacillus acetotolerans]